MKLKFFFLNLLLLFVAASLSGCDAEDDFAPQKAIVGKWVDMTGREQEEPTDKDYSIEYRADGTIVYHDDLMTLVARPSRYRIDASFLYTYHVVSTDKEELAATYQYHFSADQNTLEILPLFSSSASPRIFKRLK